MNHITIFKAKNQSGKSPYSLYDDNTFVFETYPVDDIFKMYSVMVSNFILNIPLEKLEKPIRTFRRKDQLKNYYAETVNYIILDIDQVNNVKDMEKILDYFKDYKTIIGASRGYNGIDNFNLKGILFCEDIKINDLKIAISSIHHDLKDYCKMDESSARMASLNAPMGKNKVLLRNDKGTLYKFKKIDAITRIEEIRAEYVETPSFNKEDLKTDSLENLCLSAFKSMGFVSIKNNENGSISFKHPNEEKSPGGYFWFKHSPFTMHHFNSIKTINIFDTISKLPEAKELMRKAINYDDEFLSFNTDTNVISLNQRYLEVTDEVHAKIQEFIQNENGLLSIRSPMGTGKSTIINHVIDECHQEDMTVLIITNRISVAQDFGKKYGLKVYNQDKYNFGDSLVCQYDSLWKYDIRAFDTIVMDEFISLMMHARSNLNNSSINISKFFAAFSKKLVIADAFLTGYENFLLSNKTSNIHLIDNIYRDPTTLYSYEDSNAFVQSLLLHSKKHKLTVSSTSINFINSLKLLLENRGVKVVTLTAETPDSTKNLIYGLFEQDDHDKWDVLIFSPTLTVGVSNLNDVKYHFHYDSSLSTDVISSIQMIKRTRRSKEIHMFIKDRINYVKTSYNEIRDDYMCNIGRNIELNYLFDIDDFGEPKLSRIGKNAIKIDTFKNILEFNHKDAMLWMLKYHFIKEPRIIKEKFSGNVLMKYQKQLKEDKHASIMSNINQFLELNEIEKTSLILESDANKTLRALAEIDSEIKDCSPIIKTRILESAINDRGFIKKCRYFKVAFNYTKKIWDDDDVKALVSKAVINKENDDINFYNALINYGQKEIFYEYLPRVINKNKQLKYILDCCGYKVTRQNAPGVVGHRGYVVDSTVKEYYGYIR
jgi:hypothetical protein